MTLAELRAKHGEMIRALVAVDSEDGTGIPELRKLLADGGAGAARQVPPHLAARLGEGAG